MHYLSNGEIDGVEAEMTKWVTLPSCEISVREERDETWQVGVYRSAVRGWLGYIEYSPLVWPDMFKMFKDCPKKFLVKVVCSEATCLVRQQVALAEWVLLHET